MASTSPCEVAAPSRPRRRFQVVCDGGQPRLAEAQPFRARPLRFGAAQAAVWPPRFCALRVLRRTSPCPRCCCAVTRRTAAAATGKAPAKQSSCSSSSQQPGTVQARMQPQNTRGAQARHSPASRVRISAASLRLRSSAMDMRAGASFSAGATWASNAGPVAGAFGGRVAASAARASVAAGAKAGAAVAAAAAAGSSVATSTDGLVSRIAML